MSQEDEIFFREVDEDYRRDQAIKFFQTYGAYFIGGAFIILALAAGYTFQQHRRASQAAAGGDALTNAMTLSDAGKQDDAQKALAELGTSGPGAYKTLALLHAASDSVGKKRLEAARAIYGMVAGDAAAPQALRDFATIQLASLSLGQESYENLSRSLALFRSGADRWRFAAKEILGLAAFKEGKTADAERLFGEIVRDAEAPQGMRQRAEIMLSLLLERPKADQAGLTEKKDEAHDAKAQ